MLLIFFAIVLVGLYPMEISKRGQFNKSYLSIEDTTSIKGIFVLLVFCSHFIQYYDLVTTIDQGYMPFRKFLGQLVVVMFLFYSGYGILESIKKKGVNYVKKIPVNRCVKVLLHLDIAVVLFIIFDFIIGKELTVKKVLLSLIGWANVGNSNWFIFTIVVLYLITFIVFMIFRKHLWLGALFTTALTVVYMYIMNDYQDKYWFNTALCFALGMWYSIFKEKIEKILMKNEIIYWAVLGVTAFALLWCYKNRKEFAIYEAYTILFTLLIVFGSMKIKIGNQILDWFGKHVFSIYILQRIPMTIFGYFPVIEKNVYFYFTLSIALTVLMAQYFDKLMGIIDNKLFVRKKIA